MSITIAFFEIKFVLNSEDEDDDGALTKGNPLYESQVFIEMVLCSMVIVYLGNKNDYVC